ncbi:MAG: SusC/RagA family TonB-linked outer membrane protein [Terrimonas sp.]|uniref:SusC/RagA family TonB-linked outer membrane protein n=1 Tax=Terrimonas sp. TaxID=1914338 RepID=UPI00092817E4|nr:SusC/RagA family TonB-linked outer membrane protein [Terrimonas sp.]MBN8788643.1 SusC/RagA family TonB-linked outer membrane protein [Terrimonas sp.]OJY87704.1 MAG: SusC/RagA family protein [Sphingobacteriales bacterium 40-81]PVD49423.1 SusC/RagA family TonB-linked outer membrane protein [Terrimonas sp.]
MRTKFCSRHLLIAALLLCAMPYMALAQQKISGKVLSAKDQTPLAGITVTIKSTTRGTSTTSDGDFSIEARQGDVLVFSGVGFKSLELGVGTGSILSVYLEEDGKSLSEVVVTALGVKRETKRLGYAVQEVKGSDMDKARETNFVSGLAGKVAGVQVMTSPSGVGGSARVTIRGDKSLNINKNQPLFVIDGVPITNELTGSSGRSYQELDYGNGAAMINPDDIETMTVLKGANASALYGSRAANGVIVITTKSGKNSKGIGVTVNTGVTLESPLVLPKFQRVYGQGNNGQFSFQDGKGGGASDGVDESWGPKMDGSLIAQHNSPTSNGYRGGDISLVDDGVLGSAADFAARGTVTATPFVPGMDLRKFYETGVTNNTNVSLTGANDKGDFRLSYTLLDQKGIIPNTDIKRNTFAFNAGYNFTPKLSARITANYVNTNSDNRPNLTYGTESIIYLLHCWMGQHVDLNSLKSYWIPGMENRQQFNFNYNYHDNPYFNLYENTNGQDAGRLFGNITLKYDITSWLNIQLRGGTDFNSELRKRQRAFSTQRFRFGSYREERVRNSETNMDFLVSVNKEISDKFSFGLNVGGNRQISKFNNYEVTAPQLLIPGIYSLYNNKVALVSSVYDGQKQINSLYGALQLAYNNYLFLDLTARNDWSSALTLPKSADTLGKTVNSYFYPSASLSAVISDMVELPSWVSFAKVRTSLAQVGNDTDPYAFSFSYGVSDPWSGLPAYYSPSNLLNYNLKPEISTSWEAGIDWRFFNSRLGIDFSYYDINTRNQILPSVPISTTSGSTSRVVNAGKIRNYGYELLLTGRPVDGKNFKWDVTINWSANRSKVLEFDGNVTTYSMAERHGIYINATVGQQMGDMYSIGFKKVDDPSSPYYGQQIFNSEGRFVGTNDIVKVGNYNPKWLAGIRNSFTYKNFNLSFLLDARYGGQIFSETWVVGLEAGQLAETLEGRADGYDLSKPGNGVIGKGVIQNADGTYRVNDVKLTAREYHQSRTGNRDIEEGGVFDADYIKLREVRFGYSFNPKVLSKIRFKGLNVSVVGRNLAVWSKVPHIDPETSSLSGGTIIPGVESVGMPTTRSLGVNLGFTF